MFKRIVLFMVSLIVGINLYSMEIEPLSNGYLRKAACLLWQDQAAELSIDFEKSFLTALEKDICLYVNTLPQDLRIHLSKWNERFEKFKNKLQLIKPFIEQLKRETKIETGNIYAKYEIRYCGLFEFNCVPFLYTLVGLKPTTFTSYHEEDTLIDFETYTPYKEIYKHYPNELFYIIRRIAAKQGSSFVWLGATDPLLPLPFIYKCYEKDIQLSPEFVNTFIAPQTVVHEKSQVQGWIERVWEKKQVSWQQNLNETALMLGLQPVYYNPQESEERLLKNQAHLKQNFRALFIPGLTVLQDHSPYIILYSKLLEYMWIYLAGTKDYLTTLGHKLKEDNPNPLKDACDLLKEK